MTYLQFHLVFILPPLLVLAYRARRRIGRRGALSLAGVVALALIYTTPWDNYLVWRGVWDYSSGRVLATIGYVPLEEYLFFVLQPLLTGMWMMIVLDRRAVDDAPVSPTVRWAGTAVYGAMAVAGFLLLRSDPGTYLGLILAWGMPVLAGQWAYAADAIWRRRRALLVALAVPTLYLWLADAVAIRLGIWRISETYTTGLTLAGLPSEEATFFLVTNLLVVQGLVLFLYPRTADVPALARAGR